jgi:hypothetical protein
MTGWNEIAAVLKERGLLDRPDTFLFTSHWVTSGQLAFATRSSRTPVLCYNARGDARSFAFWSRPDAWVGFDGVLVSTEDEPAVPNCYARWFRQIKPLGSFEVTRAGVPIRQVRLFHCIGQTESFPFDHLGTPIPNPQVANGRGVGEPGALR